MNRKMNPWVSLIALLILVAVLAMVCTGCVTEAGAATERRFAVKTEQGAANIEGISIITDTETGNQYLWVDGYNGGGLAEISPAEQ